MYTFKNVFLLLHNFHELIPFDAKDKKKLIDISTYVVVKTLQKLFALFVFVHN
jgi:hypothetical protein